jgi:hypothetical protein
MNVDKSTGEMTFVPGGIKWYVRHLDKSILSNYLEIFTQEVLEKMEPIVNGYFRFKSLEEIEDVEKFNVMDEDDDEKMDLVMQMQKIFSDTFINILV